MMTSQTNPSAEKAKLDGFTLLELVIVLLIISAMVTVIMPYAGRSNETLRLEQEALNIAETIRYAIDRAITGNESTRFVIDPQDRCYWLQAAAGINSVDFRPIDDVHGAARHFGQAIHVIDVDGFDVGAKGYYIIFDSRNIWPNASISLCVDEKVKVIKILSRRVEIEDSTI
ncbi:MAG: prepilin-type N-terminal cleavage/methylation domain-containing protein [Planctomycetota bacterium]|jgi:prepilin-type N-terminal cleavage/methylation domain-containing protein